MDWPFTIKTLLSPLMNETGDNKLPNKINYSGLKKKDYNQIFDTIMFLKSLRFTLITRAFSKLM